MAGPPDASKTFEWIFQNFYLEGDAPPTPVTQQAQPPGATNTAPQPKKIPKWKIVDTTSPEKLDYPSAPPTGALTDFELTEAEYKARLWAQEYRILGPASLKLSKGYRLPYVKRLDPTNNPTHKEIIDGVGAVRKALPVPAKFQWVPSGWTSSPKTGPYAAFAAQQMFNAIDGAKSTDEVVKYLATMYLAFSVEGLPPAFCTNDGRVLTVGFGYGNGAHTPFARAGKTTPNVKKAFELCGISIDYELAPGKDAFNEVYYGSYQIVDLSDDKNPMILFWDNYHHGYGWLKGSGTKWKSVRPRGDPDPTVGPSIPKSPGNQTYDVTHASFIEPGSDSFAGYSILKRYSPKVKTDPSAWTDIEVLYAYAAIASDLSPGLQLADSFFHANWDFKGKPVFGMATEGGAIFAVTVLHECGLKQGAVSFGTYLGADLNAALTKSLQATGAGAPRPNGGVLTMDMVNAPANEAEGRAIHDFLVGMALVRACANMWEKDRIATAIQLFAKGGSWEYPEGYAADTYAGYAQSKSYKHEKGTPVVLTDDTVMRPTLVWRLGNKVLKLWKRMMRGDLVTDPVNQAVATGTPLPASVKAILAKTINVPWDQFQNASGAVEFNLRTADPDPASLGKGGPKYGFPYATGTSRFFYYLGPVDRMGDIPECVKKYGWTMTLKGVDGLDADGNGKPTKLHFDVGDSGAT